MSVAGRKTRVNLDQHPPLGFLEVKRLSIFTARDAKAAKTRHLHELPSKPDAHLPQTQVPADSSLALWRLGGCVLEESYVTILNFCSGFWQRGRAGSVGYNYYMFGLIVTPPPSWLATKWWTADRAEADPV